MFVVLDTNHYDELANDSVFGRNARRRIESHLTDVFISVVSVQERDPVADHDRNKTLGYGFSVEFIRTAGENLVDTRAQVLYRFLTSCRGARAFADTGTCWPCPADASKYGNWATLPGFQTAAYGPLYPLQDATRALSAVPSGGPPPIAIRLSQNRPNPFNPATLIEFTLAAAGHVSITVFDLHGRKVRTLMDRILPAGPHGVSWNGTLDGGQHAASGVYFYQVRFGDGSASQKKMVLLR